MKRMVLASIALLSLAANAAGMERSAFGTSAAIDPSGRLWVAYAQPAGAAGRVVLQRSEDGGASWQPAVRVNTATEPLAAEGENRPKIAFGRGGEIYVAWTSPTSEKFTGDIRFARSLDGGKTWSAPLVVHHDRQLITHRFESLIVDPQGRLWAAWVDKRDLKVAQDARRPYRGAAIYYAYSDDKGATWSNDTKLADSSCECCRIALAVNPQGRVAAMWRHVFEPNERDHAFAVLGAQTPAVERVTLDRWRVDACPHQGPSLAFGTDGTGDSDQPRLVTSGQRMLLVWRNADGIAVRDLAVRPGLDSRIKPFNRDTLAAIQQQHARTPFWLVLWDLECPYCMKSLSNLAAAQRSDPSLKIVTVSTDPIESADEIAARLAQLGVHSDAYAFGDAPREALQFAIDPAWLGEKPRAYRYGADGRREAVSGVIQQ
jgi:hypothetical protein